MSSSTTATVAASSRTKPKTRILRGITVAIAGNLGAGWSDADVARWMAYNGGRYVTAISKDNETGVTHLLCSRDEFVKPKKQQCPPLKAALALKGVRIVTKDWLEDSLHRRRRRPERPYLLKTVLRLEQQSPEARQQRLQAQRERGRREGETFVDSSLYRLYRDCAGFAYRVTLRRDNPAANIFGERYVALSIAGTAPSLLVCGAALQEPNAHAAPKFPPQRDVPAVWDGVGGVYDIFPQEDGRGLGCAARRGPASSGR